MAKSAQMLSLQDFLSLLEKSGLLDDVQVSIVRSAASEHSDPKSLARHLVGNSQITKWQANQLLHGFSQLTVGKYRLLDQLGTGRVGREFLGEHVQLGRRVALKLVSRRLTADPVRLKTFLAEYRRAGSLDHPNLVHSFDVDQEGQHYYVVTEFVDGKDLQNAQPNGRHYDISTVVRYLTQAAYGLKFASDARVPHGDLKPTNLLIARDGTLKVSDLGFANLVNSLATESQSGGVCDEAAYVAPEIVGGREESITAQSDIFSLGQVCYFLLTGTVLRSDSADFATRKEQLQKQVSGCDELAQVFEKFTAIGLSERTNNWQTAIDLLQSIKAVVAESQPATVMVSSETSEKAAKKRDAAVAQVIAVAEDASDSTDAFPVNLDDSQAVESLGGFFINTESASRPKTPVKPSAAAASARKSKSVKQSKPAAAESGSLPSNKTSSKINPKVLIGGIAGGMALLALITVGVVWLVMGTKGKTDVVAEAKNTPADSAKLANESKSVAEEVSDSSVQRAAKDKVVPISTALEKPAVEPPAKAATADAVPGAVTTDKKPELPAAEVPPATTPTATAPASGLVAAINQSNPSPEPVPAVSAPAISTPVTATPAPESAKPKAFEKLPKVVDLLALADPGKAGTSIPIGEIDVTPNQLVSILLQGGEGALRGKQVFSLQNANSGVDPRNWEFAITGKTPDDLVVLGKLHLAEKQLTFEWTTAAAQQPAANLVNCVLKLSAGSDTTSLALRSPATIDPVALDLEKGSVVKFPLENIPDPKKVFVELVGLDAASFPNPEFKPESSVEAAKGTMFLWVGDKPEQRDLGFKIDTLDKSKWVEVRFSPCVRSDPQSQPVKLNKRVLTDLVGRIDQGLQLVTVKSAAVQASELTAEQKKQQQQLAEQELAKLNEQRGRLLAAAELQKRLHNTATPFIRISYVAEGEKLILAQTKGAPPPEEVKKVTEAAK